MANDAVIFGLLGAGGILLTSAVTGASIGDILTGHPGTPSTSSGEESYLESLSSNGGTVGSAGAAIISGLGSATAGTVSKSTSGKLSADRLTFAKRLAADSGLNVNVIIAWMVNEQGWGDGGGQAPNGANNWLNIGATDNGFYGGNNPAWDNPTSAADETYEWMTGNGIQDYGPPSAGIIGILSTAGQPAAKQIAAIQGSGWASGGESALISIYNELVGG